MTAGATALRFFVAPAVLPPVPCEPRWQGCRRRRLIPSRLARACARPRIGGSATRNAAASAVCAASVRPTLAPSISRTGSRSRVVEVMNTSSAASRSAGSSGFSPTSIPGTRISSSSTSRVTPGRQPELSGGVQTWLPLAMKMLADVHSATSPRSLSRITSSKPRCCAFSSQVRFIAQERIFVPANSQAAWRACGWTASLTPWPQSLVSAVSAIRSLARPVEGPAHMPPPLRTIATRRVES